MWLGYSRYGIMTGFTLVEVLVVMGLVAIISSLSVVNLIQPQTSANVFGVAETLVADLKGQQVKSMVGDSFGTVAAQQHGVYVQSGSYTLFKGASYSAGDSANFVIQPDSTITFSTTLPSSQAVFAKASGEVVGFTNGANTITVSNTVSGESKTITINTYGAITVN